MADDKVSDLLEFIGYQLGRDDAVQLLKVRSDSLSPHAPPNVCADMRQQCGAGGNEVLGHGAV
jgi:hypothetical protein|tara:strand:+ start:18725 stop:18913 length:189 start_codon:yes stop_codon:yes gene_type:complete